MRELPCIFFTRIRQLSPSLSASCEGSKRIQSSQWERQLKARSSILLLLLSNLVDLPKVIFLTAPAGRDLWEDEYSTFVSREIGRNRVTSDCFLFPCAVSGMLLWGTTWTQAFLGLRPRMEDKGKTENVIMHDSVPKQNSTPMWWWLPAAEPQDLQSQWDRTLCLAALVKCEPSPSRLTCSFPPENEETWLKINLER